jgi:Tfp pilus assembly protein PilX
MNAISKHQRGATSLVVVVLLLFASLLALLYLSRGIVFEQRTSANQMRSTQALEMAEAGVEWATGMLNAPFDIGADCALLSTANESFRKRYVMTNWNGATPSSDIAVASAQPACRFTAAGLSCSCPAASSSAVPTIAGTGGSFSVSFAAVAGETESVRVTSWGCTATDGGGACSSANAANADASARIEVILKLRPVLRAAPAAPLTCGTSCTVGGSYNITNTDVPTNGVLINAGTTISTSPGTSLASLPGQPTANALVGSDSSLSSLASADATCSNSKMFQAYFGSTIETYRDAPSTKIISCSSAADCKGQISAAYADGWRAFYFSSDLHLSGNDTLGSEIDPVTLVTPNAIDINGNWTLYGLVFSNSASWNDLGTGSAVIEGAQISCAAYKNNGNGTINYNADALKNARRFTAIMVRVPGSWKDFE